MQFCWKKCNEKLQPVQVPLDHRTMINQKVFSDTLYIILKDGVHFLEWSDTRQKLKHVLLSLI